MLLFRVDASVPFQSVLLRVLLIFLPVAALLSAILFFSIRLDLQSREERAVTRENSRVEIAGERVGRDFSRAVSDLRILARLPLLRMYLDRGDAASGEELARYFLLLSGEMKRYDQMRVLDVRGREIIRINYNGGQPAIVPRAQLQDKSERNYFRDTIALARGEMYVSPLDLNVEQGQIELPHKPVIRFGMPLFDSAGRKRGIILLNYLGAELLQDFRGSMSGGDPRQGMLLDRDGRCLSAPAAADEWGLLPDKTGRICGRDFAREWRSIADQAAGTLLSDNGLFTFNTVYPLLAEVPSAPDAAALKAAPDARDYRWKIVSFVPRAALYAPAFHNQNSGKVLLVAAYLLAALGAWIIAVISLTRRQARVALQDALDESRRIGAALRQSAEEIEDLYNHAPCGYHSLDANGLIVRINHTELEWLGYSRDEVAGQKRIFDIFTPASQQKFRDCFPKFKELGRIHDLEFELVRKDGSLLPVLVSATAVTDENGNYSMSRSTLFDMTERKKLERELQRQAHIDMLTGLNNRRHFFELAELELARTKRHGAPLAALMLDVDHFKRFNDNYGHHVGDRVLRKMSEVCLHTLREIDIVGRLGGEEFAVLLPETDGARAQEAAERLRLALAGAEVALDGGEVLHFTVSIGISAFEAQDSGADSMLKRADAALYAAKNAGRNRVRVYAPEMA